MKRSALLLVTLLPSAAEAQVLPTPDLVNPRIQTVVWTAGEEVLLTALPASGLTVMLEPGEQIERVTLGNGSTGFDIRVSSERDSFLVLPQAEFPATRIDVETDRRQYPLLLRTDRGLTAALLVRFDFSAAGFEQEEVLSPEPAEGPIWSYRLRGDAPVRPQSIRDDAAKTFISYAPGRSLPAVFALGPTGEEEVVNGYMRDDVYVIDRVYSELVFRIDEDRATARRNTEPDAKP